MGSQGEAAGPEPLRAATQPEGRTAVARRFAVRHEDDRVVVRISGALCLDDTESLARVLRTALDAPVRRVDLDLGGLTFWDCSVLNVLLAARGRARAEGKAVTVVAATPVARRLLVLTGTHILFAPPREELAGAR
ncbi:STAS domain-containing protein [Streptomyces sp. NPDC091377]|uniref:STAS domain-containing protein n=1 Tax=Streptomyces sp. NPDC091377 TaxID=3365995 RepID=UPI0037F81656